MCRSMADIRSTAAEIRRGKKEEEERKKKETTGQKYNGPLLHRAAIIKRFVKGVRHFDATFEVEGLVLPQYVPLDRGMGVLQL